MADIVPSSLDPQSHLISNPTQWSTVTAPIWQMNKLRPREFNSLRQVTWLVSGQDVTWTQAIEPYSPLSTLQGLVQNKCFPKKFIIVIVVV